MRNLQDQGNLSIKVNFKRSSVFFNQRSVKPFLKKVNLLLYLSQSHSVATSWNCPQSWRELEQANHHHLKFKLSSALSVAACRTYMLKFKFNDKLLLQAVWLSADRTFVSWIGTPSLLCKVNYNFLFCILTQVILGMKHLQSAKLFAVLVAALSSVILTIMT